MIREFELSDLSEINDILKPFNYSIDQNKINNQFFNVLIYVDDSIKGVLVYDLIYDRIEIEYIIVESSERRNGIATSLFDFMEKKHKGIKNITLEVREGNLGAIKFYENLGFRRVSIRKDYYGNENGILMLKMGE